MKLAQFRREARKTMKKNPTARRNHHLIVGERVKLSDEGWEYLKSGGPYDQRWFVTRHEDGPDAIGPFDFFKQRKDPTGRLIRGLPDKLPVDRGRTGEVVEVFSSQGRNGYFIVWDGDSSPYWVADKYVVSASSTSLNWPGNHFEGVDPMAKKNPKARRNMSKQPAVDMRQYPPHSMAWFTRQYHALLTRFSETMVEGTQTPENLILAEKLAKLYDYSPDWGDAAEKSWHYTPMAKKLKKNGRARRNMAIKRLLPDGSTAWFETPKELAEWMQLEAGSSFQQPTVEGPRLLKAGNLDGGYGGRKLLGGKWAKLEKLQASLKFSKPLSFTYSTVMSLIGGTEARQRLAGGKAPRSIGNRTILVSHGVTPAVIATFFSRAHATIPGLLIAKTSKRGTSYFNVNKTFLAENPEVTATLFVFLLEDLAGGAKKNPKLGASPTIGHAQYYRQPTNAGPYTPQTFPYGYGGRPATYKTAKKNSSRRKKSQHFDAEKWWDDTHRAYKRQFDKIYKKYGNTKFTPRWGSMQGDVYEYDWDPGEAYALRQQLDKLKDLLRELYHIDAHRVDNARLSTDVFVAFNKVEQALPSEDAATEFARRAKENTKKPLKYFYRKGGDRLVGMRPVAGGHMERFALEAPELSFFPVGATAGRVIEAMLDKHPDLPYFYGTSKDEESMATSPGNWPNAVGIASKESFTELFDEAHAAQPRLGPKKHLVRQEVLSYFKRVGNEADKYRTGEKAKKNSSARRLGRYAIQMDQDYPGWAGRGPIEANWTSDPTYAYEQFARANGSGPRGGYSSSERDALPSAYFLDPKTRSWPVSDANHAKIAIQYMTRGFGNVRTYPTLIKRLARMYPVTQQGNKAIWSKYKRLRAKIAEKVGKTMPTVNALKKFAPEPYFKAAANSGRRR